jgi:hypothetical protein
MNVQIHEWLRNQLFGEEKSTQAQRECITSSLPIWLLLFGALVKEEES